MAVPLGYMLSWRSYGTWLPGDERGFTSALHNKFGTRYASPDEERHAIAEESMKCTPFVLGDEQRAMVDQVIREHCAHKKWLLRAVNVRTNHVHLVACIGAFDPDLAIGQFKQWSKIRLRKFHLVALDQEVWARRGSTRYLWDDEDIRHAVNYVDNCQ